MELLVDPVKSGEEIDTRIQTLYFDALLFLFSRESEESERCREEVNLARRRRLPVFVARLRDTVPARFKTRLFVDLHGLDEDGVGAAMSTLATTIESRASFWRLMRQLDPQNDSHDTLAAAKAIATAVDIPVVAEALHEVAAFYRPETAPSTRFWLALAIGQTRTRTAARLLTSFSWEDDPYANEGLRQASELVRPFSSERRSVKKENAS